MKTETRLFFDAVLRDNRPISDFIDADYTFLNERLARHYGIAGVTGPDFRRVELHSSERSGVFTQASVLTVSSYPTRTSVVLRGPAQECAVWAQRYASSYRPHALLLNAGNFLRLPDGMTQPAGERPLAYVCRGPACLPPTEPAQVEALLAQSLPQ